MRTPTTLLLLAALTAPAAAQAPQALVDSAQAAYTRGDHARALQLYDSAAAEWTSPGLLYNIGNCHFKLGDIPHAVLYFERAQRLAPGDEDIRANLDLARMQVADRVNELPAFTLGGSLARLRGGRDVDQWARRSLWAGLLLFAALSAWLFVRHRAVRGVLLGLAAVAFIGTAVSTVLAAYRLREATDDSEAIIMVPKVDVRSEPRVGATTLFILHEGSKVTILQEEGGWQEVRLSNGSVGWMPPASLVRI